jgi:hypothetical protein
MWLRSYRSVISAKGFFLAVANYRKPNRSFWRHGADASCERPSGDLARHLILAGRDTINAVHYLVLIGGDPVDSLPYSVEIERSGQGAAGAASAIMSETFRAFRA